MTREVQFDEKWGFVAKKEKTCDPGDPGDDDRGDDWDHTAVDPEHRLLLVVAPGERCAENRKEAVREVYERRFRPFCCRSVALFRSTNGVLMLSLTSDLLSQHSSSPHTPNTTARI